MPYHMTIYATLITRLLGSSPSGFTTRETKVHVVCESELDKQLNWCNRLAAGAILAEPANSYLGT
jgi:hypothetical protein